MRNLCEFLGLILIDPNRVLSQSWGLGIWLLEIWCGFLISAEIGGIFVRVWGPDLFSRWSGGKIEIRVLLGIILLEMEKRE